MICQYSDIFGKPGKGLHSIRILNIAIVDVVFTIIGSSMLHNYIIKKYYNVPIIATLLFVFILGILFHKLFCVNTTINNLLFT